MTEKEKQKLNENLAKWAGFRKAPHTTRLYYAPGDNLPHEVPSFTDSLNVCFKWLEPKLKMYELNSYNNDGLHSAWVSLSSDGGWQASEQRSPSLAFCRAVEKLIDDER